MKKTTYTDNSNGELYYAALQSVLHAPALDADYSTNGSVTSSPQYWEDSCSATYTLSNDSSHIKTVLSYAHRRGMKKLLFTGQVERFNQNTGSDGHWTYTNKLTISIYDMVGNLITQGDIDFSNQSPTTIATTLTASGTIDISTGLTSDDIYQVKIKTYAGIAAQSGNTSNSAGSVLTGLRNDFTLIAITG